MRDWQNFFRAEDFLLANESLNPGLSVAYILSDKANIILREKLKKAKRVHGYYNEDGAWFTTMEPRIPKDTHTALLIDEKPV